LWLNFLQSFWRKTLKNVGFWQKLAPTLLKTKKWRKSKNIEFEHFAIPMMYLVKQLLFFGWRVFQVLQECFYAKSWKILFVMV
jgi:hypothetical protein